MKTRYMLRRNASISNGYTFRYLISPAVDEGLDLHLIDVMNAHSYGTFDSDIHVKVPEGLKMPEASNVSSQEQYEIQLNKSLYGLK